MSNLWDIDSNQLLANPMFQAGMGLLGHRADKNVNPAQAVMQGLGNAQQQQQSQADRERLQMVQQQMYGLLGGGQAPGGQPPPGAAPPQGAPTGSPQGPPMAQAGSAPPGLLGPGPGAAPQQQQQPPGMEAVMRPQSPEMAQAQRMFGILAQIDPTTAATGYGNLLSNAQRIKAYDRRARDPVKLFTQAIGAANPYDQDAKSLEKYAGELYAGMEHGDKTGDYSRMFAAPGLLTPREEVKGKEIEIMDQYIKTAQDASTSRGRMDVLSRQFDNLAAQGAWSQGTVAGGIDEFIKKALGSEDQLSLVRTEYNAIRASGIMDNLPPGTASDADVALAASGWPAGVSDPAMLASFLRGMSKLSAIKEAQAVHGAQYLGTHKNQDKLLEDWNANRDRLIENVMLPYQERDMQRNMAPPPGPFQLAPEAIDNSRQQMQSDNPLGLEF